MNEELPIDRTVTSAGALYYHHRDALLTIGRYRGRVTNVIGRPDARLKGNEERIRGQLAALIAASTSRAVDATGITLIFPQRIEYEVFPRTFYCISCNKTWVFDSQREFVARLKAPGTLFSCCARRQIVQAGQVHCCPCGNIEPLHPPRKCHDVLPRLKRPVLADPASWFWECERCHDTVERLAAHYCGKCRRGQPMVLKPAEASGVTVPLSRKFIEYGRDEPIHLVSHFGWENEDLPSLNELKSSPALKYLGEAQVQDLFRSALSQRTDLLMASKFGLPPAVLAKLKDDVLGFESLKSLTTSPSNNQAGKRVGVSTIWHVDGITIADAVYAYQVTYEKEGVVTQAFESKPGEFHVYMGESPSEGVLFELDKQRLADWLVARRLLASPPEDPARFFAQIAFDPNFAPVAQEVSRLLHTLSHAVMKEAPIFCGLDLANLSEVVLPAIPAFIIYNTTASTLGGMRTLFDNAVSQWMIAAAEETASCSHDPLCFDDAQAACSACLLLPEICCAQFNQNLDRKLLIGEDGRPGYWEGLA